MNQPNQAWPEFLAVSRADMEARGWQQLDFLLISGDAYVDHPSFGPAIIGRVLEAEGYKVGILAQPDWQDPESFKALGRPRWGIFIGGGNVDSMVARYTVAKQPRAEDLYSPGGRAGYRPDRCVTVYGRLAKQAFPELPVMLTPHCWRLAAINRMTPAAIPASVVILLFPVSPRSKMRITGMSDTAPSVKRMPL